MITRLLCNCTKSKSRKSTIQRILFLVLISLCMQFSFAEDTTASINSKIVQSQVSGTVNDAYGVPLPGASIVVKGTSNGTQTDFDGNFTIDADSNATLVVSYIGYAAQEIPINGQSTINVVLEEDATQMDEVVLVGYGTQSRVSVTSAISSVTNEDLVETPTIGVQQALQGRAAGVLVQNTGAPGTDPLVTIRGLGTFGNNTPLFVVDGVPTASLNSIPSESIESVDVLKDAASAAIYGSRGSNGVVLIKTKRGRQGKSKVQFSTYSGIATNVRTLDVLNANQYLTYVDEVFDTDPAPGVQAFPSLQNGVVDPSINTDWQDEIFQNGFVQNYDVQISGGSENITYSLRAGYIDQEGTILNTDFRRYSFGSSITAKLSDKITVGQTLTVGISDSNQEQQVGGNTVLINALEFDPTKPVFDTSTNFFTELLTSVDGQDSENPVRIQNNGSNVNSITSLVGSLFANYEIIPGLTYNITLGLNHSFTNLNDFRRSIPTGSRARAESETRKNRDRLISTVVTQTLNYKKVINDKHSLDFLVGYEENNDDFDSVDAFTVNPLTDAVENLNPNEVENLVSFESENNLRSIFGRFSYDYDKTYLFSASYRADRSSRFAPGNQWGYFPAVSAGVDLSRIFLKDSEEINNLKIRASWGQTGNNNIGDYQFGSGLRTDLNAIINGELASGTVPARLENPNLQWEELNSLNIGADIGLFNNALTFSVEYFRNNSSGLLVAIPTPLSSGDIQGFQVQNVGETEGDGFEFNLGYSDYNGDFTWGANINLGTLNSEVTSLGAVDAIFNGTFNGQATNRLFVGEAPFHFFGRQTDGIFQSQAEVDAGPSQNGAQPGVIRFRDLNGDGAINADDRTVIGNPIPDVSINGDLNFRYKNIDASIFVNGVYGNDIYNGLRSRLEAQNRLFNRSTAVLNRWSPTNTNTNIPVATPSLEENEIVSDRFIEDGSYTRIRSATIGYTFTERAINNFANGSLSKVRVYISGQNLATFSGYSGFDPEVVPQLQAGTGTITAIGLDTGTYPQPRTILAGLQVEF